ncbi:MAG: hypothetical protein KC933_12915 [Myxococcales bacterium]|nr:hypothetical protein [Myxococcales bacterium]MCB9651959.1 hypothetical protein [Deltaproteobacteria bacterium]
MAINLNHDAQRLLGAYQQISDLTPAQEQQLQALTEGDKQVCRADLEKILDAGCLAKAHDLIKCDHRHDDAVFKTAFVGRPKVVKENVQIQRPNRTVVGGGRRDPYYAKMELNPNSAMEVLVSGSKFEPNVDRPRPRLMKIVARTEAKDGQPTDQDWANLDKLIKESRVAKLAWNPAGEVPTRDLDIHWVGAKTASIETKDINEPEFDFGSSIVNFSYRKDGVELSRANAVDPENIQRTTTYMQLGNTNQPDLTRPVGAPRDQPVNDQTPPETWDKKIGVEIRAKNLPRGAWVSTPNVGAELDVNLRLGSRWLMEAGASGTVTLLGKALATEVKKDDVYFNGSHSGITGVPVPENYNISQVLGQSVTKRFGRVQTDTQQANINVQSLYFAQHAGITVAGAQLSHMSDRAFSAETVGIEATKRPIKDAEQNGLAIDLKLTPEFFGLENGASVKGFTVDVGYRDAAGEWQPALHQDSHELYKAGPKGCGREAEFTVNFAEFPQARQLAHPVEIIVRDNNNIPVARVQIPLDKVDWA